MPFRTARLGGRLLAYSGNRWRGADAYPEMRLGLCGLVFSLGLQAQAPASRPSPDGPTPAPDARILGIIPNYLTVSPGQGPVKPLTTRQKWALFFKETTDPYNVVSAVLGASISHMNDGTPRYGVDGIAYSERFGAALADMTTQTFFSTAVFSPVFHEDPRYFRKGPQARIPSRILYALSRVVITRNDAGHNTFNFAGVLGMAAGIACSNLYYPGSSVSAEISAERLRTSLTGSLLGNLLPEFWPDIQSKLLSHLHHRKTTP